jgi:Holliday junction resolvasome RuvABC ATP-dependent DNA helicase subunit
MKFIGQEKIRRELGLLIPEIQKGNNYNILLSAPSGHGKTTLAELLLKILGNENSQTSLPPDFEFYTNYRIHFIDEVHEMKTPEYIYQIMDSGNYTIILATNETGALKEPLLNRCIPFIFEPYTHTELCIMADNLMLPFKLDPDKISEIVIKCKSNPRILKILCKRLAYIFRNYIVPKNASELLSILFDVMSIDANGFTAIERRYIEFLTAVGGRASLSAIQNGIHIDQNTIARDIEPQLLYSGRLNITSRGRELS